MTLRLNGATSGFTEIDAPAIAGSNTLVLPGSNGSAYQFLRNGATAGTTEFAGSITSGTAVASTSGTSIDFTSIPSYVKRMTVMFNGVGTNGETNLLVQIGAGTVLTTAYASTNAYTGASAGGTTSSAGYIVTTALGNTHSVRGHAVLTLLGSNVWVLSSTLAREDGYTNIGGGSKTLSGTLDRLRITTVNGTDTFDAGSINIMYEG